MKNYIFPGFLIALLFTSCNMNKQNPENHRDNQDTVTTPDSLRNTTMGVVSLNVIAENYLLLKNSLGEDNDVGAATAGAKLQSVLIEYKAKSSDKSKNEILDDATEHAEHIGKSKGNIAHQREHFDFLSRDIYDLFKSDNYSDSLYKLNCPMFNEGKGAFWISENGDNHNPYFGKSMPADGVKGEKL
jgi:hypothetical protein